MRFADFSCSRDDIDSVLKVEQRNLLIDMYCGEGFNFQNLVDFYYRHTDRNAILMFIFICVFFPIFFMCVAAIADKYLATGMSDLSERFNLSPTLAAVTLIAFANGSPDLISNSKAGGKVDGALISLGASIGGFIFATTVVVSNVIINSKKEIVFPVIAISKELGFLCFTIIWVTIFSFIGKTGYAFLGCYFGTYIVYIIVTILIEKMQNKKAAEGELDTDDSQLP